MHICTECSISIFPALTTQGLWNTLYDVWLIIHRQKTLACYYWRSKSTFETRSIFITQEGAPTPPQLRPCLSFLLSLPHTCSKDRICRSPFYGLVSLSFTLFFCSLAVVLKRRKLEFSTYSFLFC